MLNPALDWKKFSLMTNRAISITSVRPSNLPNVTVAIPFSQWGKQTNKQLQMTNGAYVRPEQSVLIPRHADNANAAGPFKPGDTITVAELNPVDGSASVTYVIQTVQMDDYYHFLGVFNPAIVFNLRDLVDIVPLTESVSTILTRNTADGAVVANQVCRRQPQDLRIATLQGRQGDLRRLDVFFAVAQTLSPKTHILRWTEGASTILADIVSVTNAERIDELQRVTVEVRP